MKTVSFLLLLLFLAAGCNLNENPSKNSAQKAPQKEIISDHAYLEEAKAIARKLIEGSEKVEKKELSRSEFETQSRPLQKQLNTLIMSLEEEELRELEDFRNALMAENAGK